MSTLLSAGLVLLVFIVGGLVGYVIAVMQEVLECDRELNDIQLRIAENQTEMEILEREIEKLEKEIKEYECD